jgi:hypothetical protein
MKNTRMSTFSSIYIPYPCHTENSSPCSRPVAPRRIEARASRNMIQLRALSVDGGTTNGKYVKFEDSLLSYIAHCISFMACTGSLSLWLAVVVLAAAEVRKSHRNVFFSGSWFRASAMTTMNKKPTRCTIVLKSLKFYCILIPLYMFFGHSCAHHQEPPNSAHTASSHRVSLGWLFLPALVCHYYRGEATETKATNHNMKYSSTLL